MVVLVAGKIFLSDLAVTGLNGLRSTASVSWNSTNAMRGREMIHDLLHQLFQVHYIHEILHLLSGCVGSFLGTWAYFKTIQKRTLGRGNSG
jgi:hypothetical protein